MIYRHLYAGLGVALAAGLVAVAATSASADSTPTDGDAHIFNPNEAGLILLYGEPEPGTIQPMNFTSWMKDWKPGSKESSHWADNDYTEIQFTGCRVSPTGGSSVTVRLHQAIPFSRDKSMGDKTFTACFNGGTSRGEWSAHYDGGDNRYFTIPKINGSTSIEGSLDVSKVYVDTSKAD
ncbi:hypothetical protein AAIB46_02245 [Streptomyces sp. 35M1]|uniref:hypothetical protein n=1 Tax=Streptomyces sp. 35M1 TaxID=3142978 RepID=UPI003990CACF